MSDTLGTLQAQLAAAEAKAQTDIATIKATFTAGIAALQAQIAALTAQVPVSGSVVTQADVDAANATSAAVDDLMTTVNAAFPAPVETPPAS